MKRISEELVSMIAKKNGLFTSMTNVGFGSENEVNAIPTDVAAAASVPFSDTSMNVL